MVSCLVLRPKKKDIMQTECPVSAERVNEPVVRIVAAFVVLIVIVSFLFQLWPLAIMLGVDFMTRAFFKGQGSVLKMMAQFLFEKSGAQPKWVDAAPKKFAAGIGMIFSFALAIGTFFDWNVFSLIVLIIFGFCAILESALAFCVGCQVYTILKNLKIVS